MKKLLLLLPVIAFFSCEKEDPVIPNEEELITTLVYTLTPDGGGDPVTFSFTDLDGDGGNAPVVVTEVLASNTTYSGELSLLNESVSPAEDISDEVSEESLEHQFFYSFTGADLSVTYNDSDANGNPIGLKTKVITGNASNGQITITLKHEPDKSASGVSDGQIANAGGETDIEVTFNVEIQ
ncbi:MAG: hypothetical protein NXI00_21360 [Cytophagales bacterium]|nr:hypothetical protein [Cytophagales bacterium]